MVARQEMLGLASSLLKSVAEKYQIPLLATNQVGHSKALGDHPSKHLAPPLTTQKQALSAPAGHQPGGPEDRALPNRRQRQGTRLVRELWSSVSALLDVYVRARMD